MHLAVKAEMQNAFNNVYNSYWYVLGKSVELFEDQYANFSETKYCIGLSNGLDALHLALLACDIREGDEVIVPSNSYIATTLAVTRLGATPIFVEPNINTYNIDVSKIQDAITTKTKAIIPVHLYGLSCEMKSINEIAKANNLFVIEDNAQAHGAKYNDKLTGSWGHLNATSFYPGKILGALGDAGALNTDNLKFAEKIRVLRIYGSQKKYYKLQFHYILLHQHYIHLTGRISA